MPCERRHVFDHETHAGDAIKGFADDQSIGIGKDAINQLSRLHLGIDWRDDWPCGQVGPVQL
ncbi:hypothetical protein D3C81_1487190 [compost metagenome]